MAKEKKKVSLTLEEKFGQVLVPECEQPYEIPVNWLWTKLENVTQIIMGQSPSGSSTTNDKNYIGLIGGAADMGEMFPNISRYTTAPTKLSDENDIIISIRATLGRPIFSNGIYCLGRGVAAFRTFKKINHVYIYLFIKNIEDELREKATGSTFLQINKEILEKKIIPLPPLFEQQRIVEQIERLFAKLDRVKELAEGAVAAFEDRKSVLLHQAFMGELTAKWREEQGVSLESWEEKELNKVTDVRDGTHDSPNYVTSGFPLVTSKNLKNGKIVLDKVNYISLEDYQNINKRSMVNKGDILFAMIGTIGNPVIVRESNFAIKNVALFKNTGRINEYFLKYYLESSKTIDKMKKEAKGSTQKFVSLGYLRSFKVVVPNPNEQQEIVCILNSLLAKEEEIRCLADVAEQVNVLKKTILAKAFRGELGTNDPSEESALELLKEILEKE